MKRLTEKQANLLSAIISEGGWMSRKHIATYYGVSVAGALVKKGMLELTDTRNYRVMIDAARAALDAYDAEAFAQPVSATTDAAPAWTPAIGDSVRIVRDGENNGVVGFVREIDTGTRGVMCRVYGHWYYQSELELVKPAPEKPAPDAAPDNIVSALIRSYFEPEIDDDDARYLGAPLPTGGVSAPDAAQTAAADEMERFFTMTDAQKFAELVNQADVIRKDAAQIAALTRELEAAKAEADALRKRIAFMRRDAHFMVKAQYKLDRYEIDAVFESIIAFADGVHEELAMQHPHEDDAAPMIAALRQRDNGNRTTADNVLAMFGDGDEGTIA